MLQSKRRDNRAAIGTQLFVKIAALLSFGYAQAETGVLLEEVIVTANRSQVTMSQVAGNASIIDEDAVARTAHTHINELTQRLSGTWISRGNGQEHLTAIRSPVLTGAGGCGAFLMAQDGIPLRASGFCNVNELFEANSEIARRVEVIKGPASAAYGSNAMHGMINVISPGASDEGHLRLGLEGGSHGYYRARLSTAGPSLRFDGTATTDDGYKNDSGFDQHKFALAWDAEAGGYTVESRFAYTHLNQETAGFITGNNIYRDGRARKANPNPEAFRDARSFRAHSRITGELGSGTLTLTPYARVADMSFLQHFLPGQALEENGHRSLGAQSAWASNAGDIDVVLGVDLEYTNGFLKETQAGPTNHVSAFLVGTIPAGRHYDYDVTAVVSAAFIHTDIPLTENTRLMAGLRLERINYDYDNRMSAGRLKDDGSACGFGGCRFSRPADREDTFTNLSPKLGFVHSVSDDTQVYGKLARGFRAPQTTELYRLQNTQTVSRIDSEVLDSLELGLRGSPAGFNYDVSVYWMTKDNFIFRDTTRTNVDNGETSHRGIDASFGLTLTETLDLRFNLALAKHKYENSPVLASSNIEGNLIDTAPERMASAQLAWQPTDRTGLELEWIELGEYYEDPENQHLYPGHSLLNLRIRHEITEGLTLGLRLINLTDRKYAERADFGFGNDRYLVGESRSVYVSVSAEL